MNWDLFGDVDLFSLWRWMLFLLVGIYSTIVIAQAAWGWYVYLSPSDPYMTILRRYVVLHSLRVRLRTFGGDLGVCALLLVTLGLLGWLHLMVAGGHL